MMKDLGILHLLKDFLKELTLLVKIRQMGCAVGKTPTLTCDLFGGVQ